MSKKSRPKKKGGARRRPRTVAPESGHTLAMAAKDVLNEAMRTVGGLHDMPAGAGKLAGDRRELLSVAPPDSAHLTPATEARLVRENLAARGWGPDAIDRILSPARLLDSPDYFGSEGAPVAGRAERVNMLAKGGAEMAVTRRGEIAQAINALEREQERVSEIALTLAKQLGAVLAPAPPDAVEPTSPAFPPTCTDLGANIVHVAKVLKQAGDVLYSISDRLQV